MCSDSRYVFLERFGGVVDLSFFLFFSTLKFWDYSKGKVSLGRLVRAGRAEFLGFGCGGGRAESGVEAREDGESRFRRVYLV